METGILYIVATPIGNLEDMTYRAVTTLKNVSRIACEDTRVTHKLLARYEISKPLLTYHQHSSDQSTQKIIQYLQDGEDVAVVTDAGTPGISDPGGSIVEKARSCHIKIVPIPGVSALATLVSVSGIDMKEFTFKGFPPHKKGRQTFFQDVANSPRPVVFYESPHRFMKSLQMLHELAPDTKVIVGRELTKMFESIYTGSSQQVQAHFEKCPKEIKGEFVIIAHA